MALDVSSGHHAANNRVSDLEEDRHKKVETFQWWPDPLSKEEEELRRRAGRLLESLRRIPPLTSDIKAWENDHEDVFSLFRRGCLDGMTAGMLEAPIYHNRQIEDAWLFLFEMRRRHPNRRKQVVECASSLGASYNWSMVLHGSRKIRASLESLLPALQKEILEAANALELLAALSPNTPAVASNALPPTMASNPAIAVASNGHLATPDCKGSQERRPPPTADCRGAPEERRPPGPLDAQPDVSNATPRSQGIMPERSGSGTEWVQPVQRQSSQQSKEHSRNPFGTGDGYGPSSLSSPPPVSPGAHLLSASFGFSPAGSRETRADTISFPRSEAQRQSLPHRRYSTGFASEPASPIGSKWQQGPSWAPSSASTPFGRPPAPNPNNPFMPRARQDSSLQRPTTPINGSFVPQRSAPSTPMPQAPEQDRSRQEANGAASGDPAAIARSMALRAGNQLSSASRSVTAHTQNSFSHARAMATQDTHEDSPTRGASPAPGTAGQVRSQAATLGQRFGSAVGAAGNKASVVTRSGVAALSSKTGSRPVSRTTSPEGRSATRDASTIAVPASWAPPAVHWAMSPVQTGKRGSSSGPPPRTAGSDRWPGDGGS